MREEQHRLRPDLEATITGELLAEMQYTRQVVKEVLRYRPPAPMVPQVSRMPISRCELDAPCMPDTASSSCRLHGATGERGCLCTCPLGYAKAACMPGRVS